MNRGRDLHLTSILDFNIVKFLLKKKKFEIFLRNSDRERNVTGAEKFRTSIHYI